jgi:hypothetical protein
MQPSPTGGSVRSKTALRCLAALAGLASQACGGDPVVSCEAVGDARPVCGFLTPEDLALLPDGEHVLVSEYGCMNGQHPGALALFDLDTEERRVLFRGGDALRDGPDWGDATCPGPPPPAFSPHGIHLARRPDGALQLLVVQHGGRESVELFEVREGAEGWQLAWRGCAVAPTDVWMNDVVALPEAGFLVTHMMPRRDGGARQLFELVKAAFLRRPTGAVYQWTPAGGFAKLPGSEMPFANGIELSADGATIFVNSSSAGEVRRIDRRSGELTGSAAVSGPDNSTWADDGRLRVASFTGPGLELAACNDLRQGACPASFAIVAVDPVSLETETLYAGSGAPMGGGTVGLEVGDELFVGSFAGDRILRVKLRR